MGSGLAARDSDVMLKSESSPLETGDALAISWVKKGLLRCITLGRLLGSSVTDDVETVWKDVS